jgi:hypothetical protein
MSDRIDADAGAFGKLPDPQNVGHIGIIKPDGASLVSLIARVQHF